jgi:hypothetical protein
MVVGAGGLAFVGVLIRFSRALVQRNVNMGACSLSQAASQPGGFVGDELPQLTPLPAINELLDHCLCTLLEFFSLGRLRQAPNVSWQHALPVDVELPDAVVVVGGEEHDVDRFASISP